MYVYEISILTTRNISNKFLEKIKTPVLCSLTLLFSKIVSFIRYAEKYSTAGQATAENIAHAHLNVTLYAHCLSV
jgi:hypothetical protein